MKKLFTVMGILVLLLSTFLWSVIPVSAYNLIGYYWEGHVLPDPLYFFIEDDVSTESWTGWYNGHEEWNEAQNSPTNFALTDNIYYALVDAFYSYDSVMGISGQTWYSPSSPGDITSASVTLYEYITNGYPYYKRVSVAAHEFGHVLGLAHNSGAYLMESSDYTRYNTYGIYSPQTDDVDGVNYLY